MEEAIWAPGQVWTGIEKRITLTLRFEPGTAQPVASRSTDYAIQDSGVRDRVSCIIDSDMGLFMEKEAVNTRRLIRKEDIS
jgi:hypothetical protein